MIFDEKESAFLHSIKENPTWKSILDKLMNYNALPMYEPKEDADKSFQRWIYMSGVVSDRQWIVSVLKQKDVNTREKANE